MLLFFLFVFLFGSLQRPTTTECKTQLRKIMLFYRYYSFYFYFCSYHFNGQLQQDLKQNSPWLKYDLNIYLFQNSSQLEDETGVLNIAFSMSFNYFPLSCDFIQIFILLYLIRYLIPLYLLYLLYYYALLHFVISRRALLKLILLLLFF